MFSKTVGDGLTVCVDFSADIGNNCTMAHSVDTSDFAAFTFGDDTDSVELSFTAEALRAFLKIGTEALAAMDGLSAGEQAAKAERRAASQVHQQEPVQEIELVTTGGRSA